MTMPSRMSQGIGVLHHGLQRPGNLLALAHLDRHQCQSQGIGGPGGPPDEGAGEPLVVDDADTLDGGHEAVKGLQLLFGRRLHVDAGHIAPHQPLLAGVGHHAKDDGNVTQGSAQALDRSDTQGQHHLGPATLHRFCQLAGIGQVSRCHQDIQRTPVDGTEPL